MVKIAIQGICGRMGGALMRLITARDDCKVVAGVDRTDSTALPCPVFPTIEGLATLNAAARPDVLIDFSHPEATLAALSWCAANALPCVVCTTGLDAAAKAEIERCAENTAVFYSANMSLGINLLARLVRQAAQRLPGFDIEIIEKHHGGKLDAPSGTALILFDAINGEVGGRYTPSYERHSRRQARGADEIGIHAVRGGSIVGEHEVLFAGPDEVLSLSHEAGSRDVFAHGAITAALFLAKRQPGLYSMDDIMEAL